MPVAMEVTAWLVDKRRYQKQEGTLWLVEVRYHHLYYLVVISRCDYDLRAGLQDVKIMAIHI